MPERDDYSDLRKLIEAGADITGNLAGSILGFLVAGPIGAFAGAAASPVLKHTLVGVASDVITRSISQREKARIGGALAFAAAKIREKLDSGQEVRDDGFFDSDGIQRPPAEEVAEGVILAAQRDHEEKKLKYYGNLLGNLAFTPGIDRAYSNFLIAVAEQLTYRQLCLLRLIQDIDGKGLREHDFRDGVIPPTTVPVLYEIYDLYSRGLINGRGKALLGLTNIAPTRLRLQGAGAVLFNLMELFTLDVQDVNSLIPLLR
jgi:hypothetical protein